MEDFVSERSQLIQVLERRAPADPREYFYVDITRIRARRSPVSMRYCSL